MSHLHVRISENFRKFFLEQVKKHKFKTQKQYLVHLAMQDGYKPQATDF